MSSTSANKGDDDPFCLDDMFKVPGEIDAAHIQPVVATGLSDEEDAARALARRFDRSLGFCRNCEQVYRQATHGDIVLTTFCPRCKDTLHEVGTEPRRRKHT